ncbi:MAG TPA: hypothetical protein DG761_11150 [Gammaproteobacteria bacterium]|nr:hypothetical protein [Gammaproteobacteria bacterium]
MLTIAASVVVGFFGAYFIAGSKPHWLAVALGLLAGLVLFLTVFFASHIIFLGILQSFDAEAETWSILRFGRFILIPLEGVPWIMGLGVLIAGLGSAIGRTRAKSKNRKRP